MYTDNNPLTYVLSSTKLNATGLGWIGELYDFNFTIHHQTGKGNYDANVLSRMLSDDMTCMKTYTEIVPKEVLQAVACSEKSQDQGQVNWVSAFTGDHTILPNDPVRMDKFTAPTIDIKHAVATDQVVRHWLSSFREE